MFKLLPEWKTPWKFYSAWFFAFLIALPAWWPLMVAILGFDPMPEAPARVVQLVALFGLFSRFVAQTKPPVEPPGA